MNTLTKKLWEVLPTTQEQASDYRDASLRLNDNFFFTNEKY